MAHLAHESEPQTYSLELQVLIDVLRGLKPKEKKEKIDDVFSTTLTALLSSVKGSKTAFIRCLFEEIQLVQGMPEFEFLMDVKQRLLHAFTEVEPDTRQVDRLVVRARLSRAGIPLASLEE